MPWNFSPLLIALMLVTHANLAHATLEVSLTVSGDISEIQAILAYIDERNQQPEAGSENPLRIDVHSISRGSEKKPVEARPVKLATPQVSTEKLTPGQPSVVTVAVRDDQNEVDTLAIQIVGTNLTSDLYDDGTRGDVKAGDNVWSVTLTPMEATPAGHYELSVSGFDRHGHALLIDGPDGEEQPLRVRTQVSIER